MRYLILCCLLPILPLCSAELTQEQQDEQEYQAYQEQVRAEQLAAMEARQRAEEIVQIEKDVQTLKADYPALTPDAALAKLRADFRQANDVKVKWSLYCKLREIERRVKTIQARNANGKNVPTVEAALTAEKSKPEVVAELEKVSAHTPALTK